MCCTGNFTLYLCRSDCHDIALYKKMVAFIMAYSFTEPPKEKDDDEKEDEEEKEEKEEKDEPPKPPPMMVPMADILNHVAKNNAQLDFGASELKMLAIKPIKKVD